MDKTTEAQSIELLTFCLDSQKYGLEIGFVREIRGWTPATPLPQAPASMVGVVNLRGAVLPVMNLSLRLGLNDREWTMRNVVIVVETNGALLGLLVDAVLDIISFPKNQLQPAPIATDEKQLSVLSALAVHDEEMLRVLKLENITLTASVAA